jgi:hypothetical protein
LNANTKISLIPVPSASGYARGMTVTREKLYEEVWADRGTQAVNCSDGHPVLGQGSGLVRADDRGCPTGLRSIAVSDVGSATRETGCASPVTVAMLTLRANA